MHRTRPSTEPAWRPRLDGKQPRPSAARAQPSRPPVQHASSPQEGYGAESVVRPNAPCESVLTPDRSRWAARALLKTREALYSFSSKNRTPWIGLSLYGSHGSKPSEA